MQPRPLAGAFEEANGGTLSLDEISELPPRSPAQAAVRLEARMVRRDDADPCAPRFW